MLKPPFRPRKRVVNDPYAAEFNRQGQWPYVGGKGATTRPARISIDGKQIVAFRPGIIVVSGEVEDHSPCSEN